MIGALRSIIVQDRVDAFRVNTKVETRVETKVKTKDKPSSRAKQLYSTSLCMIT